MISKGLSISKDMVRKIVLQDVKKRFVPHRLTAEQRSERVASCPVVMNWAGNEPDFFKKITADESLFHAYD